MFREAQKVSFALSEKQKGLCAILVALKFRAEKYNWNKQHNVNMTGRGNNQ